MGGTIAGVPIKNNAVTTCPEEHHTTVTGELTADGNGDIAATAIITPTSGFRAGVHITYLTTDGSSGEVTLDFVTSNKIVGRLYASNERQSIPHPTHIEGAIDEVLTLAADSIGSGSKVFFSIQHVEES